jgi:cardiolipin synthase
VLILLSVAPHTCRATSAKAKHDAIQKWSELTLGTNEAPRAFVKAREVRLYFDSAAKVSAYAAKWKEDRLLTDDYSIRTARLRPISSGVIPKVETGWKEAMVLTRDEAEKVATDLVDRLTPPSNNHGVCYEAFFADRVLYRDEHGVAKIAFQNQLPEGLIVDHHYFTDESLFTIRTRLDEILAARHPEGSLFLVLATDAAKYAQPLLIDRDARVCVGLSLAALYDSGETGVIYKATAQAFSAAAIESHGIALVKNPVTSATRLADALIQDVIRLVRVPALKPTRQFIPAGTAGGMDLAQWETWLDRHTGTLREEGSLSILVDGTAFYPRLREAMKGATNHISAYVYIYDRDDLAVEMADLFKACSRDVSVTVSYDRVSSLVGSWLPKTTPLPADFARPASVSRYLRKNSDVQVRPWLNPWICVNHSKLFLVDAQWAWIGGMNIGREYAHEWHDAMFEVQGPVVASLEMQYRRDWAHSGPWGDFAYASAILSEPKHTSQPASEPWMALRRLPTTRGLKKPFMTAVIKALDQARNYIYIENGYLFDHGIEKSLAAAHKRGVDVRVIFPGANNFTAGIRGNMAAAERLRRRGVRVFFWPGMTHAKALLVDGWACIGSANLNQWSLRISKEENLATSDPRFAAKLKAELFDPDFKRSHELTKPISLNTADYIMDSLLSY